MRTQHIDGSSRRRFLGGWTLAGAAGLLGLQARRAAAEPPLETTEIRLTKVPGICNAPQYVAEEFLRSEGFRIIAQGTDWRFVTELRKELKA